ncbi:MAG: hypothetical protein LBT04_05445 [Prevotellaceae bacterium]|jgi:hypothetical protein|nr:hypothetical protein [Prevotellaceae bacterium]
MDNISDYIYVIIIIGSIIVSIAKSATKKKAQTSEKPVARTSPKQNTLDDVFRKMLQERQVKPLKSKVVVPAAVKEVVMNDSFALEKHHFEHQHEYDEPQVAKSINLELNNNEDWQRAFIHSEIFNRKY